MSDTTMSPSQALTTRRPGVIINPGLVLADDDQNQRRQDDQAPDSWAPFTVRPRVLSRYDMPRAEWAPLTLGDVYDDVAARVKLEDPREVEVALPLFHFSYNGNAGLARGRMSAQRWQMVSGVPRLGVGQLVSKRALSQLCSLVGRGLSARAMLERLASIDDKGAQIATASLAKLVQTHGQTPMMLRLVNVVDPADPGGQRAVMVRAVMSQSYSLYDDLAFITDMLADPDVRNMAVVAYHRTDDGMRVRFSLDPKFKRGQAPEVGKPIPMVEAWNSETACRGVGLHAGMWTLICTNGMVGWTTDSRWDWRHSGNTERIRRGVKGALDQARVYSTGLVDKYNAALDVAIDGLVSDSLASGASFAAQWLGENSKAVGLTDHQVATATNLLGHDTLADINTLAGVTDAVTRASQLHPDIYVQQAMERAASKLMDHGLNRSEATPTGRVLRVAPPVALDS